MPNHDSNSLFTRGMFRAGVFEAFCKFPSLSLPLPRLKGSKADDNFNKEFCLQISHVANDGHPTWCAVPQYYTHKLKKMSKDMKNKATRLKKKERKKLETSQTVGESTCSPNSKRLHYHRFLPRDQSIQPTTITAHLLYLHVSLIMVCVYSLEDQLPTEMAGCVIKSLPLGAPKNVTACK